MSGNAATRVHPEMPTPAEKKALIFLSSVIVLGGATRLYRSTLERRPVSSESANALKLQISAVDSAIAHGRGAKIRKSKRPRKGAPSDPPAVPPVLDLDLATAEQIETLRGIGPSLARRIVADRDSLGAFGSLEGFQRVRGVGPALAEKLAANVTFSGVPRPVNTVVSRRSVMKDPKRKRRRREGVY
jgi:competence ComEA-like helix-hairpin-helix protein